MKDKNVKTWSEFGRDYLQQLKGLFRSESSEKQPLMKKIVVYSFCLLIGILCCMGMAFNGYLINVPCFLVPLVGLVVAMLKDIKRYRQGVETVASQEMGKRSPTWVRVLIALFGIAVLVFAITVALDF